MANELELFRNYLAQLLSGNRDIFANISTAIDRYLYRFGGHRLADPENLRAEALGALVHNLQRGAFRGENFKQFNAYLRAIVLNTVLREVEAEKRRQDSSDQNKTEPIDERDTDPIGDKDLVKWLLNRLNSNCSELLALKYLQDLDNSEIAEKLGLKEVTVRVRIHRCTENAKEILRNNGLL